MLPSVGGEGQGPNGDLGSWISGKSLQGGANIAQRARARGKVVAKIWFAKTKVCVETPVLEGKKYVVGRSRYLDEKNGLSKKDRASIVKEIRTYIKDRGWE